MTWNERSIVGRSLLEPGGGGFVVYQAGKNLLRSALAQTFQHAFDRLRLLFFAVEGEGRVDGQGEINCD